MAFRILIHDDKIGGVEDVLEMDLDVALTPKGQLTAWLHRRIVNEIKKVAEVAEMSSNQKWFKKARRTILIEPASGK